MRYSIGDPHDCLDVLGARRADDGGREIRGGAGNLEGILEVLQRRGVGCDLVRADRRGERGERLFEFDLGDAGWESGASTFRWCCSSFIISFDAVCRA